MQRNLIDLPNYFLKNNCSMMVFHVFTIPYSISSERCCFQQGLEPKGHEGSLRLLGMHFVKTGILQPSDSHIFARLMKYREEADYNPSYIFTADDIKTFKQEAEEFKVKIMQYLEKIL